MGDILQEIGVSKVAAIRVWARGTDLLHYDRQYGMEKLCGRRTRAARLPIFDGCSPWADWSSCRRVPSFPDVRVSGRDPHHRKYGAAQRGVEGGGSAIESAPTSEAVYCDVDCKSE